MPKTLASIDTWKDLEREINARFKMNAAVFDADGVRITDFANWGNKLCPVVKGNPASLSAICAVANKAFLSRAKEEGKPIVDCCDAGLLKICVPIQADGEFLGFAGGCGCLPAEDGEIESFLLAKTMDMPEAELADLEKTVQTMTKDEVRQALEYIAQELAAIQKP